MWWAIIGSCLMSCRIGEAKVPGPSGTECLWTLGVANPTGLQGKETQLGQLPAGLWLVSETHLTAFGLAKFRQGLACAKSPFKYVVPGASLQPRAHSATVGTYSGVCAISTNPTRRLPATWEPNVWETGRVLTCATRVHNCWVQGGICYGFPAPGLDSRAKTDTLLSQLEDNIVHGTRGPRFLGGDFNTEVHQNVRFQQWKELGWQEIQDVAHSRWGVPPSNTCKGATRVDQLWISPELVACLEAVVVNDLVFSDHAILSASFRLGTPELQYIWRMPQQLPWQLIPESATSHLPVSQSCHLSDPTEQYRHL